MSRTKEEHAAYMREYNRKNKDKINARRRELRERKKQDPEEYEKILRQGRDRNSRYYEKHKDKINEKARANNWNYDPERAKIKRERHYKKHPVRNLLRSRKCFAKKHDLEFTLTEEWYYSQFDKGCSITKIPFDDHGSDTPWVAHIDRINPDEGYTPENCRLVCACYNIAKKHWTDQDVLKMAEALISESNKY